MHNTAPRYGAIHPDEILPPPPPSFWHLALAWSLGMNECARLVHFKMRCLSGQGTANWELWRKGWCWSHSLQEIPPKKHHLGAHPFPQLLFSCYCKFRATFIFPFFSPRVISSPSLIFLKWLLLHHCCFQAWCVWPKADVCSKARAQDLPAEAGRGLLAALPCP